MSQYILKSDVIAEIEKLKSVYLSIFSRGETEESCYEAISCISICNKILSLIDNIEVKNVDLEKIKCSPSKKQIESLKDMLKYNIGVFDYQKFMEVNSLYEDLTNSKLFDETD